MASKEEEVLCSENDGVSSKDEEVNLDYCIGCESGVDFYGAHLVDCELHPLCCKREMGDIMRNG